MQSGLNEHMISYRHTDTHGGSGWQPGWSPEPRKGKICPAIAATEGCGSTVTLCGWDTRTMQSPMGTDTVYIWWTCDIVWPIAVNDFVEATHVPLPEKRVRELGVSTGTKLSTKKKWIRKRHVQYQDWNTKKEEKDKWETERERVLRGGGGYSNHC